MPVLPGAHRQSGQAQGSERVREQTGHLLVPTARLREPRDAGQGITPASPLRGWFWLLQVTYLQPQQELVMSLQLPRGSGESPMPCS